MAVQNVGIPVYLEDSSPSDSGYRRLAAAIMLDAISVMLCEAKAERREKQSGTYVWCPRYRRLERLEDGDGDDVGRHCARCRIEEVNWLTSSGLAGLIADCLGFDRGEFVRRVCHMYVEHEHMLEEGTNDVSDSMQ